jgi:hypothetical protein
MALTREAQFPWKINDIGLPVAVVNNVEYALGSVDNDGRPPYFFQLWDEEKEELVARLESEPVPVEEAALWDVPPLNGAQLIPELFELANRSASGAPEVFNRLLTDLDGLDNPFK